MQTTVVPLSRREQRLRFLADELGCYRSEGAARAAYYAEALRVLVSGRTDGCDHADVLAGLLYARETCDELFPATSPLPNDLKSRTLLARRFVEMGEVCLYNGRYHAAPTRVVRFSDDLYVIAGTIPLGALRERGGTSIMCSGSARYSKSINVAAIGLDAAQWLPFDDVSERWLRSFTARYQSLFVRADAGMHDGLDIDVFCSDGRYGRRWVALGNYGEAGLCLVRYHLVQGFKFLFASIRSTGSRRIEMYAEVPADYAIRYECAMQAANGAPKRLNLYIDAECVRFRNVGLPQQHRQALQLISHEELIDDKKWSIARLEMVPVIRHIARSTQVEVAIK